MVIRGQNKKHYNIHSVSLQGKTIYCRDGSDRRVKHELGVYKDRKRATEVFKEIGDCSNDRYEMPME